MPPTIIRSATFTRVQTLCGMERVREKERKSAEDACRCWFVSAVDSGRTVSRVAARNCGGTAGREESVRPCGPSSGLQGNEDARCELVLDGFDCCNLEWEWHESAFGDGLDEPGTPPGSGSSLQ